VDSDILTHLTQFAWAMSYNDALCHVIHIYRPIIMQLNHSLTETQIIVLNLVGSTALCDTCCLLFCRSLGLLQQCICNYLCLMKYRPYVTSGVNRTPSVLSSLVPFMYHVRYPLKPPIPPPPAQCIYVSRIILTITETVSL